ncbi:MAG: hypothetical protein F2813_00530 [Actinobacteria bacterium]|uniref:Unannotated protein n=1 Tax=freshwater metagenome TaxID=449393 RepID=A0A6J5Z057_9ZZZZ|nr:hypothetical protein [Actinomycetota bacterium]
MTRLAQIVFALLVLATGAAFFVAQELKTAPPVLLSFRLTAPAISPNGDGRFDRQEVSFRLKRSELVDVAVVDERGDEVRELASGITVPAYTRIAPVSWDGRAADGTIAPDGRYRIRVRLRREGRSLVVPQSFLVDDTPPKVTVISIGPNAGPGPELLPRADGAPARIRINAAARDGRVLVFRTWPQPALQVATLKIAEGSSATTWDGRGSDGRPVAPGTYLAVAQRRDAAGVLGSSVALDREGLPESVYGRRLPGRGGITVRPVAAQPPLGATKAKSVATVNVDANGSRFAWSLARVGAGASKRGSGRRSAVRVKPPGKASQVYLFTAKRGALRSSVPLAVDDAASHPVLVVLPLMTWQGRNPVDDDGDGEPNLLTTGGPVNAARVLGTPLPQGFGSQEKPILRWLGSARKRYDVTTDYALATGTGPSLTGHSGVLLIGETVWLPPALSRRLRRFVTSGGTVVEAGVDSLLRGVTLTKRGQLTDPLPPATTDIFSTTLAGLQKGNFEVTAGKDSIGLFEGTSGLFSNYDAIDETTSVGKGKIVSSAVGGDGEIVIVAFRLGRGLVIRYGLPQLPSRIETDSDVKGLIERSWQLLSR